MYVPVRRRIWFATNVFPLSTCTPIHVPPSLKSRTGIIASTYVRPQSITASEVLPGDSFYPPILWILEHFSPLSPIRIPVQTVEFSSRIIQCHIFVVLDDLPTLVGIFNIDYPTLVGNRART